MSTTTAPKTFRARSLTDALAQVRDELGPDAVVVRRREGLEGGVAGFFQKAVVEIEAQPGGAALADAPTRPGTSLLDDDAPIVPEPMPAPIQIAPGLARGAAAAGFAAALATAEHARPATPPAGGARARAPRCARTSMRAVDAIPHAARLRARGRAGRHRARGRPRLRRPSRPSRALTTPPHLLPAVALAAPPTIAEADRVAATLRRAGLSEAFSAAVLDEATVHGLPFTERGPHRPAPARGPRPGAPAHRRPASAARAPSPSSAPAVSGKTAVIARLAIAYAAAGRLPVAVIALRPKDSGAELARLLAPAGVPMWATDDVEGAAARIANLRRGALVLVDTPALPPQMRTDPFVADAFAADLRRLGLDEVHFALPADARRRGRPRDARRLPRRRRRPHRRDPQRRHRPPGHARRAGRRGGPADLLPGRQRHACAPPPPRTWPSPCSHEPSRLRHPGDAARPRPRGAVGARDLRRPRLARRRAPATRRARRSTFLERHAVFLEYVDPAGLVRLRGHVSRVARLAALGHADAALQPRAERPAPARPHARGRHRARAGQPREGHRRRRGATPR